MAQGKVTLQFKRDKDTKNKIRYAEQADEPVVGSLYVRKSDAEKLGDELTVTIEPA